MWPEIVFTLPANLAGILLRAGGDLENSPYGKLTHSLKNAKKLRLNILKAFTRPKSNFRIL